MSRKKRRAMRLEKVVRGWVVWRTRSWSREDVVHKVGICLDTGEGRCTCEDFVIRHAKFQPTILDDEHLCFHLKLARRNLKRRIANGSLPGTTSG